MHKEEGMFTITLTMYSLTQNDQCMKYFRLSSFKFDCHVKDDHINDHVTSCDLVLPVM